MITSFFIKCVSFPGNAPAQLLLGHQGERNSNRDVVGGEFESPCSHDPQAVSLSSALTMASMLLSCAGLLALLTN